MRRSPLSDPPTTLGAVTTMLGVHVGAREDDADPIAEATESGADGVQVFLADPQDWKAPKGHPRADELRRTDLAVYVHAPYTINVATTNNRIRIPSRKLLGQHAAMAAGLGARGMIVHGGPRLRGRRPRGRASTTGARCSPGRPRTAGSRCRS